MVFNTIEFFLKLISRLFPFKSIKLKLKLRQLSDNIFETKIKNKKIKFYIKNFHCFKRYNTIQTKEKDTIEWINGFKINDIFWDIGANIGIYSIYAARIKKTKVVAFEPIINSAQVLRKNIELNNLEKKIDLFALGLGNENKNLKLYYHSNHAGSARHSLNKSNNKKLLFENIITFQPDKLIELKITDIPNHIKIDTDGNELDILKNCTKILKSKNLKSLCIENEFGKNEKIRKENIINILKKNGFKLNHQSILNSGYNMYFKKNK